MWIYLQVKFYLFDFIKLDQILKKKFCNLCKVSKFDEFTTILKC